MPYETYDIADFLLDDSFVAWVKTGRDSDVWQAFLTQYPDKRVVVDQAKAVLLTAQSAPVQYPTERQVTQIWNSVRQAMDEDSQTPMRRLGNRSRWYWAAAASVTVLLGLWAWFAQTAPQPATYRQLVAEANQPLREVVNGGDKPLLVSLADGSTVRLQRGSRLSYPARFAGAARREVYLSGEAFFEVAKNPVQPFVVFANELVTKVLGTSFTIRAYERDDRATVVVRTGKVSVFTQTDDRRQQKLSNRELEGVVLTPNQQLTFDRAEVRLAKSLVDKPELITTSVNTASFEFENTPIAHVFATLESTYGVDIVFDEDLLKNCRLSASLADEPLFEKLRLICKTLGASYTVIDAQIVIQSSSCTN